MKRAFADPFDSLPLYEREIVRLRAYELTLTLYYKEVIEREILDTIECHDRWHAQRNPAFGQRAPKGAKGRFRKALNAMVADGAITEVESFEIQTAIDFRNDVAHRIDHLFSDLEQGRFNSRWVGPEKRQIAKIKEFDHQALKRMRKILKILDRITLSRYNIVTFRFRGHLMFSSTEKALLQEIHRSRTRLYRLARQRKEDVDRVNKELKIGFGILEKLRKENYFSIRWDKGKMTARGQEFCYRLLDEGLSDISIAHIFQMRIRSIQTRRRSWRSIGASMRSIPNWDSLPIVHTPSRFQE